MIKKYWSCSKFALWLLKRYCIEKPNAAEIGQWKVWKDASRTKNKFVYWFVEEFLDFAQEIIYFPFTKFSDFRYYLIKRFVMKTHYLNTKLTPGVYHEIDTRILYGLFETLVDFIEVEKARIEVIFDQESARKYGFTGLTKFLDWIGIKQWRSAEAGIKYLEWEMSLTDDVCLFEEKEYAPPTPQSLSAKEQYELYNWWKNVRPLRPDPYDASGWTELCEKRRGTNKEPLSSFWCDQTDEDRAETHKALNLCNQIEQQYFNEDTEMLIRLIKIRANLWT
jgi:hypothetical protein